MTRKAQLRRLANAGHGKESQVDEFVAPRHAGLRQGALVPVLAPVDGGLAAMRILPHSTVAVTDFPPVLPMPWLVISFHK